MIKNLNTVTNVAASCVINDELVMTMRATIDSASTWNVSKNIRNSELYLANQEECDKDYLDFEEVVISMAK